MTAALSPHLQPPITGEVIVKNAQNLAVSCPWCQRLMRAADGVLTLAEIAQKVHLPLKVCEKLVVKAVQENWMEVVSNETQNPASVPVSGDFWFEANQALHRSLGSAAVRLLQEAALMTRLGTTELTPQKVNDFLIALELVATEQQRQQLNEYLDELRTRYAA